MLRSGSGKGLPAVFFGFFSLTSAAAAGVMVIESDAPEIKVGAVYVDETKLEVPPGKRVRVLVQPGNDTKVIEGPAIKGDEPIDPSAFGATRNLD